MKFNDPIMGTEDLIREKIQSPDYTPGVQGWSINKDGTAEFNDLTARGEVEVGAPPDAVVRITTGPDGGQIEFEPPTGSDTWTDGIVVAKADSNRPSLNIRSPYQVDYTNGLASLFMQGRSDADVESRNQHFADNHTFFGEGLTYVAVNNGTFELAGTDFITGGHDRGLGLITNGWTEITAATGAVAAETVAYTTASMNFRDGRAYSIEVKGLLQRSAIGSGRLRLRKGTTVAGATWWDSHQIYVPTAGQNAPYYQKQIVSNTTGATVATELCMTCELGSAGAGTANINASSTQISYVMVRDIGEATDYPNAKAIV